MRIQQWCDVVARWRAAKGFATPAALDTVEKRDMMLGKLMLVVTEVAEAAEAVRHADVANFQEEIADTCIRIFDICGTMGIDLEAAIAAKMGVNVERPQLHGKHSSI